MSAGEWLKYTINVSSAPTYTVDVRVTSEGGTFHVEIDGANVTCAMTIPETSGWQKWTTLTKSGVALPAGAHVLRLVVDSNTGGIVGNFNWRGP